MAGRLVGNFPQAFSHVSLVNAACNLSGHRGGRPSAPSMRFAALRRAAAGRGGRGRGGSFGRRRRAARARGRTRARREPAVAVTREIAPGVIEIDTLLGGWEQVTAGYLVTGAAPVLVETGSQSSVPALLEALAALGVGARRPRRGGRDPHPPRPRRRRGRRGPGLPERHRLRAREGGAPSRRPHPPGRLGGAGLRAAARLALRPPRPDAARADPRPRRRRGDPRRRRTGR